MTTYCKNCGHESHCGNPLREAIEICKMCRCSLCENESKVIYKRYSSLCFHDQSNWDWE